MQKLLASLVIAMTVKDEAAKASLSTLRAEAKKTGQDVQASGNIIVASMQKTQQAVAEAAGTIVRGLEAAGNRVRNIGLGLTAAVTVPLGLMSKGAKETAADFEQAMNRVRSALIAADPRQINELAAAAMKLGPAAGKSSIEAAEAIETLAKNGLDAAQILGGALEETLKLSVIGFTDTSAAANLTTDVMTQFHKTATDLRPVVDRVTGALDVSKLSFNDYRLAIGQTGGVAGGLGYSFEDMNVAIAASASLFASGSDAGTSFKTFLLSLKPQSEEAAYAMKVLGLEFFDATGKAKPLGEIAELLNTKLSKLSDKSKTDALTKIFGTDAMRTALALMDQGAAGLEKVRTNIDAINAQEKLEIIRQGEVESTKNLANQWERLGIRFGSVIVPVITAVKNAMAAMIGVIADAPQWFFNLAAAVSILLASIGPLTLALLAIAKIALPLLLLRLGPVAIAFAALINPVGVLIRLLGQLALMAGASTMLGAIGGRLVALAGPLGIAVTLLMLFVPLLFRTVTASEAVVKANAALTAATDAYTDAANKALTATDANRVSALKEAAAKKEQANQTLAAARAKLADAQASLAQRRAELVGQVQASRFASGSAAGAAAPMAIRGNAETNVRQAQADVDAINAGIKTAEASIASANAILAAAASIRGSGTTNLNLDKPDADKKSRQKKDETEQNRQRYERELAELKVDELQWEQRAARGTEERSQLEMRRIRAAQDIYNIDVDNRRKAGELTQLQANELKLQYAKNAGLEQSVAWWASQAEMERDQFSVQQEFRDIQSEKLRLDLDEARTMVDRRRISLAMLDLDVERQRALVEHLKKLYELNDATDAEVTAAEDRLKAMEAQRGQRETRIRRETMGPLGQYAAQLPQNAAELNEAYQRVAADGLQALNDGLAQAIAGSKSLGDIFHSVAQQILADLLRIQIQRAIIQPLANMLTGAFGGGAGGGGGGGGWLSGIGGTVANFGGPRAAGGRVSPGSWYMVGEKGPEPFIPDSAGTIVPNGGLRARVSKGDTYHITVPVSGAKSDRDARRTGAQVAAGFRREMAQGAKWGAS